MSKKDLFQSCLFLCRRCVSICSRPPTKTFHHVAVNVYTQHLSQLGVRSVLISERCQVLVMSTDIWQVTYEDLLHWLLSTITVDATVRIPANKRSGLHRPDTISPKPSCLLCRGKSLHHLDEPLLSRSVCGECRHELNWACNTLITCFQHAVMSNNSSRFGLPLSPWLKTSISGWKSWGRPIFYDWF